MRVAEIDWPLFWHALSQLDPPGRDLWLARWVFADDGARLSLRAAPPKMNDFVLPPGGEGSETNKSLVKIRARELASTRLRAADNSTSSGSRR